MRPAAAPLGVAWALPRLAFSAADTFRFEPRRACCATVRRHRATPCRVGPFRVRTRFGHL